MKQSEIKQKKIKPTSGFPTGEKHGALVFSGLREWRVISQPTTHGTQRGGSEKRRGKL